MSKPTPEAEAACALIRKRADVEVPKQVERGRLTAAEGSQLSRWLRAMADDIAAGLHLEGANQP